MSRTTLCALTAAGLVTLSLGLMAGRFHVLGDEVLSPRGPFTWKVTMKATGQITNPRARITTITPLDFDRQHIHHESFRSTELLYKPPTARHPDRRQVLWSPRAGVAAGVFTAIHEFYCDVNLRSPRLPMQPLAKSIYAAPQHGACLESESLIESDHREVSATARELTANCENTYDQIEALYQFASYQVANEPSVGALGTSAVECLTSMRGDARAKSRLLTAMCRNRGIPARLVTGLALTKGPEQTAHVWVEAWLRDHWWPLCPFYHHFGRVPPTYLVFGFGDLPIMRGREVMELDYAFLIEHTAPAVEGEVRAESLSLRQIARQLSLDALPGPERRLVEFLLLMPVAGLIVCVFRNIIGLNSFGTFAPALVGLAFRELTSLPGILVFLSIVLVGWMMRRMLDRLHLLQVPRTAVMLNLVVMLLIATVVVANYKKVEATKYIPLFPIVILTGMVERFWTLEVEDGAGSSFRTLLSTMFIAGTIALFLSWSAVTHFMFRFPEMLGAIMAVQLLIGRYTGYRLSELFRFRDFLTIEPPPAAPAN